jgi:hypothetical protein
MESVARDFDLPTDSPQHEMLADTAWMGGPLIGLRFYLGRFIGKNLFRESDGKVEELLVDYFSECTSAAGAELMRGLDGWPIAEDILRYRFEQQVGKPAYRARKLTAKMVLAVELYLKNPSVSMAQLAKDVKTTEKQLERNSLLNQVRWVKARRERTGLSSPS